MVDVGAKDVTDRRAVAPARRAHDAGDGRAGARPATRRRATCSAAARIAGHPGGEADGRADPALPPAAAVVRRRRGRVDAAAGIVDARPPRRARAAQTGVEMEAMTAASVAALTVYDMVKGVERGVEIESVALLEKSGGKHDWRRSS